MRRYRTKVQDSDVWIGQLSQFFVFVVVTTLLVLWLDGKMVAELLSHGIESGTANDDPLVLLPANASAPDDNLTSPAKVQLGKQLFFDPRLSGDNSTSCTSCHIPNRYSTDGLALGMGIEGTRLKLDTPTCLNVGFFKRLFWDGRATTLEQQALSPIQSPEEMNQDLTELETELQSIPTYVRQFKAVFGSEPDRDAIAKALAAFQRTLVTRPSPLDRFLMGDKNALSKAAQEGLELFLGDAGCVKCHRGPLLSDNEFHRLRVSGRDQGRAKVTGRKEDRFRFRTPSLRNIAETGPYMHDGSLKTLDDVVMFYYRGIADFGPDGLKPDTRALIGQSFSEIPPLVAFLESLTGKIPQCQPPLLPAILAHEPDTSIAPAVTGENEILTHTVESPYQAGQTDIRVLLPTKRSVNDRFPVVYVLPVEAGSGNEYGDGLREVQTRDIHNKHRVIFVAPTFSALPWYADHPTKTDLSQETFFVKVVVPFVEQAYPAAKRAVDRLLLGFSKSGWGAWTLLLRHPQVYGRAAAWDAPLSMKEVGKYGTGRIVDLNKTSTNTWWLIC